MEPGSTVCMILRVWQQKWKKYFFYVLPNELMNFLQTFNAARSCFLPAEEKKDLLRQLKKLYGMEDDDN